MHIYANFDLIVFECLKERELKAVQICGLYKWRPYRQKAISSRQPVDGYSPLFLLNLCTYHSYLILYKIWRISYTNGISK